MNGQDITRARTAILLSLLPAVAVASYPDTIARESRRKGWPEATAEETTRQLTTLETLGKVERIAADGAQGTLSAADTGWKLTAEGVRTAEQLAYA